MAERPTSDGFRVVALFHPSTHVFDLDEAEQWYERVFGRPSTRLSPVPVDPDNRMDYSTFTFIRDVLIDSINPKLFVKNGVQQYPDIDEPHLKAVGWYVEGLAALYEKLRRHGVMVVGLPGVTDADGDRPPTTLGSDVMMYFTAPDDVGLRYQFIQPMPMRFDPRMQDGWELAPPGVDDPLGIEFTSHHTILTDQVDRASRVLVDVLGGEVIHVGRNELLGASSTYVRLADSAFELATPDVGTPAYADWQKTAPNDTYHAITFKVADLARARRHLEANDVRFRYDTDDALLTDPRTSMGIPWGFRFEALPGDDRR